MAFIVCEQPHPNELAISNPADQVSDYADALKVQHKYWDKKEEQAEDRIDLGRHTLAHTLTTELWEAGVNYFEGRLASDDIPPETAERNRNHALGTLAMSLLARSLLGRPNVTLGDAHASGYSTMILDIYKDATGAPLPPRLHMLKKDSGHFLPLTGATNQWYRQDNLYVRHTIPAEASDPLRFGMQVKEYAADFPAMLTLYPYIASRHA